MQTAKMKSNRAGGVLRAIGLVGLNLACSVIGASIVLIAFFLSGH